MRLTSRMLSAISFGVFWRFAPSTIAIMRSRKVLPGSLVMRMTMRSLMHARAAGDGAAVAAALADDRRGFAGDRRFIDARDAFDDFAVGGNDVARFADDEIAFVQVRSRRLSPRGRSRGGAPSWSCASCAASRPALCRGLPPSLRRSSRRAR